MRGSRTWTILGDLMDAKDLIVWALEASLYLEPRRPGLTAAEMVEIGAHFGVGAAALDTHLRGRAVESGRVVPFGVDPSFFATYEGDLRNVRAFDHVVTAFKVVAETAGQRPPIVDREAVIASGTAAGIAPGDLEFAIATYRAFEAVPEAEPRWELRRVKPGAALPSAQREGPAGRKVTRRERYGELVGLVRTLVERRRSAASASAAATTPAAAPPGARVAVPQAARTPAVGESPQRAAAPAASASSSSAAAPVGVGDGVGDGDLVHAFRGILPALGQGRLVSWWAQLGLELRIADEQGAALTRCVLAATLAEIALTMACPRPREARPDPKGKPARWALPEIARAASTIGVDDRLRARLERMHKTRQRVYVARVMELSGPVSDITLEEAQDASEALDATLRLVLAWSQKTTRRG